MKHVLRIGACCAVFTVGYLKGIYDSAKAIVLGSVK